MKARIINSIILIIFSIIIYGCATFTTRGFRKEIENPEVMNINKFEGNYSFHPICGIKRRQLINASVYHFPDSLHYTNAYDNFVNEKKYLRQKAKKHQINLSFVSHNKLRIKVLDSSIVIKDTILGGMYKKGMFYIDNEYLKYKWVPYLFGGCYNDKRRIGLTKKGNLIINEAVSKGGAFFLVFGGIYRYNLSYVYERK